jgi:hypothetical protein
MNLALWSGQDAADAFLSEYAALAGCRPGDYDPRWDVLAAAGSLPDLRFTGRTQAERLDRFVCRAVRALHIDR